MMKKIAAALLFRLWYRVGAYFRHRGSEFALFTQVYKLLCGARPFYRVAR